MKISALATAVPKNCLGTTELEEKFGRKTAGRISLISGVRERRVVQGDIRALELMLSAATLAIEKAGGSKEIDAILVVTQTPEYKFPATACIIQDKLGIGTKALAFDINLGCSGYVYGLISAYSFIKSGQFRRILLIAGDLTQSTASPNDSSTYPLFGDAYSATIVERNEYQDDIITFDYGTDGSGKDDLITYIGGARYRDEEEYRRADGYTIYKDAKYPNYVYMNGGQIFEFCVRVVPEMLSNLLQNSSHTVNTIDYFFLHQANSFILKHLCTKLNLPEEKVPLSIEKFGNTSSASIPLTLCDKLGGDSSERKLLSALLGFGVGYSWAGMLLFVTPKVIAPIVEV